jgi:hypothetical protein
MVKKILLLYGNKGVGKSTIAEELVNTHGWTRCSFADPIRFMLSTAFGHEMSNRFADKECPRDEFGGKSIREAMMLLGTEWGRNLIYPNIWVDCVVRRLKRGSEDTKIVIDDARFDNERDAMVAMGAKLVRLTRKEIDSVITQSSHASEIDWPNWSWDFSIENSDIQIVANRITDWAHEHESN